MWSILLLFLVIFLFIFDIVRPSIHGPFTLHFRSDFNLLKYDSVPLYLASLVNGTIDPLFNDWEVRGSVFYYYFIPFIAYMYAPNLRASCSAKK